MKEKSLRTRYNLGDRSPEAVLAYNDYQRAYRRAWLAGWREHRVLAMASSSPAEGEEMKLDHSQSAEEKSRWKIVRTDDYADVPGNIITADEITGECCLMVRGETKTLSFGPRGIRIVGRRR